MIAEPTKAIPEYIQYLLMAHKSVIKSRGVGSARENINLETFESQRFPIPTVDVQRDIVRRMRDLTAELSKLDAIQRRKITLFGELQLSILSAAFSGQLSNMRAVAA